MVILYLLCELPLVGGDTHTVKYPGCDCLTLPLQEGHYIDTPSTPLFPLLLSTIFTSVLPYFHIPSLHTPPILLHPLPIPHHISPLCPFFTISFITFTLLLLHSLYFLPYFHTPFPHAHPILPHPPFIPHHISPLKGQQFSHFFFGGGVLFSCPFSSIFTQPFFTISFIFSPSFSIFLNIFIYRIILHSLFQHSFSLVVSHPFSPIIIFFHYFHTCSPSFPISSPISTFLLPMLTLSSNIPLSFPIVFPLSHLPVRTPVTYYHEPLNSFVFPS